MSETMMTTATRGSSRSTLGALSALSVVLIWASWLVSTRHSAGTALTALDLSLLRYGLPAIVLAPVWLRTGLWPKNTPKLPLVLMVMGSGAVFFQIVAFGMHHTPASAAGVLLPGAMPFFTAVLGIVFLGERPDTARKLGLAAIVIGGLVLLAGSAGGQALSWISYTALPLGATFWAIYTHAFRKSGLNALQGAALIAAWSTIINLALLPFFGTGFLDVSMREIGLQVLTQGVLSGLVSMLLYGWAVSILGGTQAAAYTAITPLAAAFAGAWLLGETLGGAVLAAAVITGVGVLLSTGLMSRRTR